ncbi:hypothetical protein BN2475_140029 [Paraburkholderia ribeironis]|uniref:Uncharacterized protein n=1 Tax=Paraburkholderia ribeironis TaxID=1247936 RepID=A0A1N7RSQ7_9BURK|nr:hypothetical protein BN2475_140029 [Paraburkholderia ribeironis]
MNNRAETSHLPTRRRERQMQGFRDSRVEVSAICQQGLTRKPCLRFHRLFTAVGQDGSYNPTRTAQCIHSGIVRLAR